MSTSASEISIADVDIRFRSFKNKGCGCQHLQHKLAYNYGCGHPLLMNIAEDVDICFDNNYFIHHKQIKQINKQHFKHLSAFIKIGTLTWLCELKKKTTETLRRK